MRLPPEATLVVASSMPVRDVETFWPVRDAPPRVLANRGANGIDGLVSTAFGVAAAATGPVVLLIGDVALAHDIGGLARRQAAAPAARRSSCSTTTAAGSSTSSPSRARAAAFEEHVATPHGLDFAHAAALYGLRHERVAAPEPFRDALDAALARAAAPR